MCVCVCACSCVLLCVCVFMYACVSYFVSACLLCVCACASVIMCMHSYVGYNVVQPPCGVSWVLLMHMIQAYQLATDI